jgi:hypothetical protein
MKNEMVPVLFRDHSLLIIALYSLKTGMHEAKKFTQPFYHIIATTSLLPAYKLCVPHLRAIAAASLIDA